LGGGWDAQKVTSDRVYSDLSTSHHGQAK